MMRVLTGLSRVSTNTGPNTKLKREHNILKLVVPLLACLCIFLEQNLRAGIAEIDAPPIFGSFRTLPNYGYEIQDSPRTTAVLGFGIPTPNGTNIGQ